MQSTVSLDRETIQKRTRSTMARNILNETLPHRRLEVSITDELASAALNAFFKYFEMKKESRENKSLFEFNETLSIEITLSKLFQFNKLKLHRIALPHPMEENPDPICLIVKSGFRNDLKESLLNKNGIELIVTLDELPKEYKQFEDKRKLHNSYNKFMCDENVQSFLPKILGVGGSHWRKPIFPINISQNITEESLLQKIENVRGSTYWHFSEGTNISVKFGHSGMTKVQLVENLVHVIPQVVSQIPEGWNSIARVGIKSVGSIYFPLYFAPPQAPTKVDVRGSKKRQRTRTQNEEENENGKSTLKKKRFFEKDEETQSTVETDKKTKKQEPVKQQKVAEHEGEQEQEEQEPEEEEERTSGKKLKLAVKRVTPVSKKDILKQKLKSLSARRASNGNTKPKVKKAQTP